MGTTRARGRLPRRVYWVRRGLVLGLALLLVLGIGKLLGASGSDPSATDAASNAAAGTNPSGRASSVAPAEASVGPVAPPKVGTKRQQAAAQSTAAAIVADGPCLDDEVTAVPIVEKAAAGGPIVVTVQLSSTRPACTFTVDAESLVVKIASGDDRIWSSQDCTSAIKKSEVVVRSGTPVSIPVTWSGRRSDEDCSTHTGWAMPGYYHVYAAAIGSAATDVQFQVTLPDRPVVTRTAKPSPTATPTPTAKPTQP